MYRLWHLLHVPADLQPPPSPPPPSSSVSTRWAHIAAGRRQHVALGRRRGCPVAVLEAALWWLAVVAAAGMPVAATSASISSVTTQSAAASAPSHESQRCSDRAQPARQLWCSRSGAGGQQPRSHRGVQALRCMRACMHALPVTHVCVDAVAVAPARASALLPRDRMQRHGQLRLGMLAKR